MCQHLDHSAKCRWALKNSGAHTSPEPGKGSKKYDDGKHKLQPATQASGPPQQWDFTVGVDEKDRPCQEVLRLLEDLFFNGSDHITAWADLLRKYRECFGKICLQRTRLYATAAKWKQDIAEVLEADEDIDVRWAAWHSSAARLLGLPQTLTLLLGLGREQFSRSPPSPLSNRPLYSCLGLSSI